MDTINRMESDPGRETLSRERIQTYLEYLMERGCTQGTIDGYRRNLEKFLAWLPESQKIQKESLTEFRAFLLEQGYMPRTVNMFCSSINSYLGFMGLTKYQLVDQIPYDREEMKPELSRKEYLRLIFTAKVSGKTRTYLLVKVFATTGITVLELPRFTVEAVKAGKVVTYPNGTRQEIRIPPCVRGELIEYIHKQNLKCGPVFVTRTGKTISRTVVTGMIQSLSEDAGVDPEKCNPRCLRKLYLSTREKVLDQVWNLFEVNYDHLLEQEQIIYGWEEGRLYG